MLTQFLLSTLLAAFLSGCGTLLNNDLGMEGNSRPYGGVVIDYGMGTGKELGCGPWWFLDMPFSLAGDTALLPIDLYNSYQAKHDERERRAVEESLRRFPPDPDPLVGWKHVSDVKPAPAIVTDYQSYIEELPPDQRKALIVNDYMVKLFEDSKGSCAMEIRVLVEQTLWRHILVYDESNSRVKVMRYANGYFVP